MKISKSATWRFMAKKPTQKTRALRGSLLEYGMWVPLVPIG